MQFYNDYNDRYKNGPSNYHQYDGGNSDFSDRFVSITRKLFGTPGKTIQKIAIIDFVAFIIVGIVCAFIFPYDNRGKLIFWEAVGYVLGGWVSAYISSLLIYAFGSFVQNTEENKETLLRIEKTLKQIEFEKKQS